MSSPIDLSNLSRFRYARRSYSDKQIDLDNIDGDDEVEKNRHIVQNAETSNNKPPISQTQQTATPAGNVLRLSPNMIERLKLHSNILRPRIIIPVGNVLRQKINMPSELELDINKWQRIRNALLKNETNTPKLSHIFNISKKFLLSILYKLWRGLLLIFVKLWRGLLLIFVKLYSICYQFFSRMSFHSRDEISVQRYKKLHSRLSSTQRILDSESSQIHISPKEHVKYLRQTIEAKKKLRQQMMQLLNQEYRD